jgi:asparagine synthase (glutamine-hydrolysing)
MCGLVGIFDLKGTRSVNQTLVKAMNQVQHHRGPDETGHYFEPGLGFGHKRLSIIDLASGQQPMTSACGQVVIVYNGEIYNFSDVRQVLLQRGYPFRTTGDTEVILNAWLEWGEACVNHFRGMFAFALWDKRTQSLFLARDRLGVKPLHYAFLPDGWFIFSSELKGLLAHPELPRTPDPLSVEDYFAYGYIPDPRTILVDARKLPAASTLRLHRGTKNQSHTPKAYWDVHFKAQHNASLEELTHQLRTHIRDAVALRLVSEVPLGAFLSGGVDSSVVVAAMARLSDQPVNTCSIGFDNDMLDESAYAARIAALFHTNHHSRQVNADDFSLIDRLTHAFDEPFADASALPTYRVSALARENVTVALSGDGGDELFAGYRRHRLHAAEEQVRGLLPLTLRRTLFGTLGKFYPKLDWAPQLLRAKTTLQSLGMSTAEAYFHSVSVTRDSMRQALFTPALKSALQGYHAKAHIIEAMAQAQTDDVVAQAQYADIKVWLPGDILTKVDRASMAVSLEAREPLLDHVLLEWAAQLPTDMRLRDGQGKYILKKAYENTLPSDILYRPKQGFVTPLDSWFRGPLRAQAQALSKAPALTNAGWFNCRVIDDKVNAHIQGQANHGRFIWQLFMFEKSFNAIWGDTPIQEHVSF